MTSPLESEKLRRLALAFEREGAPLYAVGGAVRNGLLGLPVNDVDITARLHPETVEALCARSGFSLRAKGAAFGTLDISSGDESYEYACFRAESYSPGGAHRPDEVRYSETLEEDAVRRDFTVNAVYREIISGEIVDPTGGVADIGRKLIRATSDDPNVIMRDDGLRIMRMARFAAELGFKIDPETLEAARANADGLKSIAPERIWEELLKLLMSDARYGSGKKSLYYGLEALHLAGAYRAILPELARCDGVSQRRQYHAYDVLHHSLHAVEEAPPVIEIRLAMLLHDVAKPVCLSDHGNMHGHEEVGAEMAREILGRLRCPRKLSERVATLVRFHMYDLNGNARERTIKKRFVELGPEVARELPAIREADVHGSGIITGEVESAARWRDVLARMEAEGAPMSEGDLACNGNDICEWLGIAPGPEVGRIKRTLLLHCACRPRDNTRERLRALTLDAGGRKE